MGNFLYGKFKEALLSQSPDIDLDTDTIKVALVSSSYTPNTATDQYYSSVSGVIGTPATLANKSVTGGVFNADDVTFTAVTSSTTPVEKLVIYKDSGAATSSPLIAIIDSATSGLPVTPNGGDITISWDNGTSKIFAL